MKLHLPVTYNHSFWRCLWILKTGHDTRSRLPSGNATHIPETEHTGTGTRKRKQLSRFRRRWRCRTFVTTWRSIRRNRTRFTKSYRGSCQATHPSPTTRCMRNSSTCAHAWRKYTGTVETLWSKVTFLWIQCYKRCVIARSRCRERWTKPTCFKNDPPCGMWPF